MMTSLQIKQTFQIIQNKYGRGRHFLQGGISDGVCLWNWICGGIQGKRMADGMVEEKEGEAGGETARNSERDRTHENQLRLQY